MHWTHRGAFTEYGSPKSSVSTGPDVSLDLVAGKRLGTADFDGDLNVADIWGRPARATGRSERMSVHIHVAVKVR